LWIVSAPSGGGKTSLTRAVIASLQQRGVGASISVSYTTRDPRPGEEDGQHYHFVEEAEFDAMQRDGHLLEHANVFGRRYGTGRAQTEAALLAGQELFLDIDWQGARQLRSCGLPSHSVFLLPPSVEALEERLRARGQDDEATIARRMAAAWEELQHFAEYEFLIVNGNFDDARTDLEALVLAQRLRRAAQVRRHADLLRRLQLAAPGDS
jgi:guanylate kinase